MNLKYQIIIEFKTIKLMQKLKIILKMIKVLKIFLIIILK